MHAPLNLVTELKSCLALFCWELSNYTVPIPAMIRNVICTTVKEQSIFIFSLTYAKVLLCLKCVKAIMNMWAFI